MPARYRLPTWLNDGRRLVAVSDASGEETFVILTADGSQPAQTLPEPGYRPAGSHRSQSEEEPDHLQQPPLRDLLPRPGYATSLSASTRGNPRPIAGFDWSPDGEWVAYSVSLSNQVAALKLWKAESGEIFPVTRPVLRDICAFLRPWRALPLFPLLPGL